MNRIYIYVFVITVLLVQAYGQINWTKHPDNPVLMRGNNGSWDDAAVGSPSIIYDGTLYHMWYNGNDGNNTNIGYATSTDKINWEKHPTPVLEHGSSGSWDDLFILHPTVYFDGTTYHMWYTGTNGSVGQIGYATSPDSINWTKYSENPVLTPGAPGSWDDRNVNGPEVLFIDGVFHMWYGGFNGSIEQTGHATSLDGKTWEKDELNPVLKVGGAGSWDIVSSSQSSVLFDGTYYHMWYCGGPDFGWKIGYASSEDGRHWRKVKINNPVLDQGLTGSWDRQYVAFHTVCYNTDSTGFDMWYTGADAAGYVGDIGFAQSPIEPIPLDITWNKHPRNPIFKGKPGEFDSQNAFDPAIIFHENQYHMWYSGYNGGGNGSRVGYAISDDGISWERHPNPVLQTGSGSSWDNLSVQQTSVLFDGTTWHMWYCGINVSGLASRKIGYATSTDKIHWTKYEGNPVLTPGAPGSWDDAWVGWPKVLFINGMYHMWYTSDNGSLTQIGHATSPDGITWQKDALNPVLTVGTSGAWDDNNVSNPTVSYDGHTYHMWYCGAQTVYGDWKAGYAVSLDGRNWQKVSIENPVLDLGNSGAWDDKNVADGLEVFIDNDSGELKMWYGGGRSINDGQIGFASSIIQPVVANFVADTIMGKTPLTVQFNDRSTGYYAAWLWDFGDGNSSTEQHPLHIYETEGTFNVSLTVSGPGGSDTKTIDIVTAISDDGIDIPDKFALQQNFPNPFNPITMINYQLPTTSVVEISIYNLLGQKVATLVNKKLPAGRHQVQWNAGGFATGVYYYRIEASNFEQVKKMILIK